MRSKIAPTFKTNTGIHKIQKRKLGNSKLEVSALGLGCMRMSFGDRPVGDKQEMISFLQSAVDHVEFTPDDLRNIDSALSKITVQGDRYSQNLA